MPITQKDAPSTLPSGAKNIYVSAFNNAYKNTCDGDDECSARIAWSAVKSKYRKEGETWTPKAEVQEFSMAIVKASYDKKTSTRRWRAVASDTDEDSYNDSMSLELFSDFMRRIEEGTAPPEEFRSDFWSGGKPYLSVSHYPDLNGKGVPGPVDTVYIDGNRLKATGRFDDTPIGRACFESICTDLYGENPIPEDEKIRISIAFLDWKHKHKSSGFIFERSEDKPICPECLRELFEGEYEGREFLRGHLIHLGMTRVPVNKRTDMEVERSMTTRKEDATSIVGEEIAEELEEESKLVGKSEALVIKSEDEEETQEILVEEGKGKKEMKDEEEDEEYEEEDEKKKKKEEKSDFEEAVLNMLSELTEKKEVEPPAEHPLDGAIAQLKSVYDVAVEMDDAQVALQTMQEPFEVLVRSIQDSMIQPEPEVLPEEPVADDGMAQLLSTFREEIGLLRAEMAALKQPVAKQEEGPKAPPRRSIGLSPELLMKPEEQKSKTPKLREIVNRSVGIE